MADTNVVRADIAAAIEAALAPLPTVTVYAYWVDNASVPSVVIDDHECHVDDRKRVNTWIVRVLLPAGPKVDSYRLGDDIVTLLTPLAVDPHSLAVESIIPTSSLLAGENMPGYTVNLTDDRKALCAERPPPPPARATGAVMGTPGYYTPVGAAPPPDAAALYTLTAEPVTPWDPGTYVVVGDATEFYWDGTAWVPGRAPTPPPPQLVLTVTDVDDLTVAVAITNEDPTGDPVTVDWGDGTIDTQLDHTYANAGTYTLIAEQTGRLDSVPVDVTVTAPAVVGPFPSTSCGVYFDGDEALYSTVSSLWTQASKLYVVHADTPPAHLTGPMNTNELADLGVVRVRSVVSPAPSPTPAVFDGPGVEFNTAAAPGGGYVGHPTSFYDGVTVGWSPGVYTITTDCFDATDTRTASYTTTLTVTP